MRRKVLGLLRQSHQIAFTKENVNEYWKNDSGIDGSHVLFRLSSWEINGDPSQTCLGSCPIPNVGKYFRMFD